MLNINSAQMPWFLLVIAGSLEMLWLIPMKASDGFTRPLPTIATFLLSSVGFYLLSISMRSIPVGTAYAVWTGIGAVGAATMGIVYFGEQCSIARIAFIVLIIIGIVGLKLTSNV